MTKLVANMGAIYRVSDRAYRRILKQIVAEENYDLDKEGKFIGYFERNLTDMDAEEAQSILDDLKP